MTANITYTDGTVEERQFTELFKAHDWIAQRITDACFADVRLHPSGRYMVHPANRVAVASITPAGCEQLTRQQST